jgi:hypothetical protein
VLDQCNSEGTILPLSWGKIELQKVDESVEISWETLSELNNDGFSIERSANGNQFTEIAWVPSKGDGIFGFHYEFMDQHIESGLLYYRIKQVDMDGAYSYSNIVQIEIKSSLKVYQLNKTLIIKGLADTEYSIELLTTNPKVVLYEIVWGNKLISIPVQDLSKGIYFLRIRDKEKIRVEKVFIN